MTALLVVAVLLSVVGFVIAVFAESRVYAAISLAIGVIFLVIGFLLADELVKSIVWLSFAIVAFVAGWSIIDEGLVKKRKRR